MLIGVVSDTHNNLKNIKQIISLFNKEEVSLVVHTGDITNATSLKEFSNLNCELVGVYGNNDRNEVGLQAVAKRNNFNLQDPPNVIRLKNKIIAIFHEPDFIDDFLDKNQNIDIVFHGHTHRHRHEMKNNTLLFNPGESAGMFQGSNVIGVVDLNSLEIKRIFF